MKKLLVSLTVLALTACATPTQIRNNVPSIEETSQMPANRVAGCILESYDKVGLTGFAISQPRSDGGYSVKVGQPNHPHIMYIVDIKPTANGSLTIMYDNSIWTTERDRAIVRHCGKGLF